MISSCNPLPPSPPQIPNPPIKKKKEEEKGTSGDDKPQPLKPHLLNINIAFFLLKLGWLLVQSASMASRAMVGGIKFPF